MYTKGMEGTRQIIDWLKIKEWQKEFLRRPKHCLKLNNLV